MILATRYAGNREVRAVFGPDTSRPAFGGTSAGRWSWSGELVTNEQASGLSAVGRAIRLVSGLVASLPIGVFEGQRANRNERPETPQGLLFSTPVVGMSDFDWRWDIASSLEATENAYLVKVKAGGEVVELLPVPCQYVRAYLGRDGAKVFEIVTGNGIFRASSSDVLHVRGQTVGGGPFGVSRIEQHREPLGSQLAAQKFEGSYLRNHARPDVALVFPSGVTQEQAKEWKEFWTAQYGGAANAGQAIPLGAGADIKPIPLNLRDAQFIEGKTLGIEEVGRIMDVDPALLGAVTDQADRAAALELFLRIQFMPRLKRIERAFRADLDLFPVTSALYPAFEISDLIFTSAIDRAKIQHEQIQDGRRLVDEIRAEEGMGPLPPLPDDWTQQPGMVPQITPVGGAANPTVGTDDNLPVPADRTLAPLARNVTATPLFEVRVEQDTKELAAEVQRMLLMQHRVLEAFAEHTQDLQLQAQQRELERARQLEQRHVAELEAIRQAAPTVSVEVNPTPVTVEVAPTPVTIENTVNVEPIPVNLQMELPAARDQKVSLKRDQQGRITSATIEDE